MSLFNINTKKVIDRSKVKKEDLKLEIKIILKTTNVGYGDNKYIAEINIDENLICNTSDYIKQIKNEIESILGQAYEKINLQIDNSGNLADGYKEPEN